MIERKGLKFISLILLILTVIFFLQFIINPNEMIYSEASDIVFYHYQMQKMKFDAAQENTLLLWNPMYASGISYINDPESFMFYPPYILHYFFKPDTLFNIFIMLHVFLAGFFTYLFCRSIELRKYPSAIAAIIFMFTPKLIAHLFAGHSVFLGIAYTPLLFLIAERYAQTRKPTYILAFSVALALQILSTHPQMVLYSTAVVAAYFLVRVIMTHPSNSKKLISCAYMLLGVLLALALCTVYLLPIIEGTKISPRADPDYEFSSQFSLPPQHFLTLALPHFFGTPISHTYWGAMNYWELTIFLGLIPLILALIGLWKTKHNLKWLIAGLTLFAIIFSLGKFTPLYYIFFKFIPGFGLFRAPGRMLFLFSFLMAILAGLGVEWLTSKADKQTIKKFLKYAAIVSGILIISTIVVQSANTPIINYGKALVQQRIDQGLLPTEGQFSRSLEYYLDNVPTVLSHILGDLWILITMAVLFTLALFLLFRSQKHAKFFLAAIIFFELLLFATPHIMTKPTEDIFNQDEITSQLLEDPELFRVFDTTKKYPFYKAQVHGIDFVERGSNILTKEYAEFTDKIYDNEISEALPYLNLLNVKYLVIEINKTFVLEKNNNTLPRAYIVRNAEVVETSDELNNLGAFNPRETVLLAKIPETPLANPGSFKETEIVKYKPNHIDIQLNLETAGYLVLSEMHYPNWNAYDNGKKVEILQANMIMRTVYLEKGPHYVQFIYQPKNLQQGLLVTLISLVVLIGLFFYLKKQSQ